MNDIDTAFQGPIADDIYRSCTAQGERCPIRDLLRMGRSHHSIAAAKDSSAMMYAQNTKEALVFDLSNKP